MLCRLLQIFCLEWIQGLSVLVYITVESFCHINSGKIKHKWKYISMLQWGWNQKVKNDNFVYYFLPFFPFSRLSFPHCCDFCNVSFSGLLWEDACPVEQPTFPAVFLFIPLSNYLLSVFFIQMPHLMYENQIYKWEMLVLNDCSDIQALFYFYMASYVIFVSYTECFSRYGTELINKNDSKHRKTILKNFMFLHLGPLLHFVTYR